jgi:hypothetical protein
MEPLLGRNAFPGPAIVVGASGATFAGEATFDGCIAIAHWPRADVERLLPRELELAANAAPCGGVHPVVFVFGQQNQGAWIWGGLTLPIGLVYHEFLIGFPFVRHRDGRMLHTYIPRMYASNSSVVWDGNLRYGLSKELAAMRWWGSTFVLTTQQGTLLFHAVVKPEGRSTSTHRRTLAAAAVAQIFSLPMLGRRETGHYVCSYFGWDLASASVRSAAAYLSIDAPLVSGLEPRLFHAAPGGSITVRSMKWQLSWPVSCRF